MSDTQTKTNKMPELKQCPFCGKVPTLHSSHFKYSILHRCDQMVSNVGLGKKREVIEKWNIRFVADKEECAEVA